MSIDVSSMIPVIYTTEIKVNKEENSQKIRPIEESSESSNTGLHSSKEEHNDIIIRDDFTGIGDTYSTKGELVKEIKASPNGDKNNITVDFIV